MDESIQSLADIEAVKRAGAKGVSLKLIKLGGFRAAVAAGKLCRKLGLKINVAAKIAESSIGTAAAVHLACAVPNVDWGVSLTNFYLAEDIVQTRRCACVDGGRWRCPTGPRPRHRGRRGRGRAFPRAADGCLSMAADAARTASFEAPPRPSDEDRSRHAGTAFRSSRSRACAHSGGPLGRADPRRPRRRRGQDRADRRGRRHARLGPALRRGRGRQAELAPPTITPAIAASARSRSISRPRTAGASCSKLAARSDIVLENFKTGGLAKFGLDYASLVEGEARASSIARSPASARTAPTRTAPATTCWCRAWAASWT